MEFLADYKFDISYIKGKENKVADALSRRRHISAMTTVTLDLRDQIVQQLEQDEFYVEINLALIRDLQDPKYSEFSLKEDGLLRYRNRIYIPNHPDLRRQILNEFHSAPYSGHPGVKKIHVDLRRLFYWFRMKRDISDYVARCLEC